MTTKKPRPNSQTQQKTMIYSILAFAVIGAVLVAPSGGQAAIFGRDQRTQAVAQTKKTELARAIAVAVLSSNLIEQPNGRFTLDVSPSAGNICSDELFAKDASLAFACTGFLIAPDLIATAGHCMVNSGESHHDTDTYCTAFPGWLFDFQTDAHGNLKTQDIDEERLYRCKEVIYAVKDEGTPFRDFALVRLNRPVTGRTPLKLSSATLKGDQKLFTMGFPLGMPMKFSPNGDVLKNDVSRESFITNLSVFDGNSGSPVFNEQNEVVGILTGGTPSIWQVPNEKKSCLNYNRCDENGLNCLLPDRDPVHTLPGFQRVGSEVQRIAPVIGWLRQLTVGP